VKKGGGGGGFSKEKREGNNRDREKRGQLKEDLSPRGISPPTEDLLKRLSLKRSQKEEDTRCRKGKEKCEKRKVSWGKGSRIKKGLPLRLGRREKGIR